jgi:carnitine 3-dehydrogenase
VIGHPINPPHLIPLVEVAAGAKTTEQTVQRTLAFYTSIGKRPIRLRKENPGHVVNRLQAALYREVVGLIARGVLDVSDADDAVCWGPGLRWGLIGPNMLWHLGSGPGGIGAFMDPLVSFWQHLNTPVVTPELKQTIVDGVLAEAAGSSIDELSARRDPMLLTLLGVRSSATGPVGSADVVS